MVSVLLCVVMLFSILLRVVIGLCDGAPICAIMVCHLGRYRVSYLATRRAGRSAPLGLDKPAIMCRMFFLCADANCAHATLAQSVERLTRNEQVDSSILSSGSIRP